MEYQLPGLSTACRSIRHRDAFWWAVPALLGLALAVGGCIRLTDAVPVDGGSGDTTTNGGDDTSPDTNGDALPDQPDDDANDVVGHVAEVYCDDVIAIDDIPTAGQTGVFQSASSPGGFSSWLGDDEVAFDASSDELTNRDRDVDAVVTLLGTDSGSAQIVNLATNRTTITLADSSFWTISIADGNEALDWTAGDMVVIVQPTDAADPWRLVNLRQCEVIQVERIS